MDQRLRDFLDRQRANASPDRGRQTSIAVLTDVHLAPDASFWLIGPLRDEHDRFHIDRFDADGELVGSFVAPASTLVRMADVRFVGEDGTRVLGYDPLGTLLVAEVVVSDPS
jgi:hypothetical protein